MELGDDYLDSNLDRLEFKVTKAINKADGASIRI